MAGERRASAGEVSGRGALVDGLSGGGDGIAAGVRVSGIEAVQFTPAQFRRYVAGILAEAAAGRVQPLIGQTYPLDRVSEAYDRMMSGKARFRVVLTIGD